MFLLFSLACDTEHVRSPDGRLVLSGAFAPVVATRGETVEFSIVGDGTAFSPGATEVDLGTEVDVLELTVLDAQTLSGRMRVAVDATRAPRDVMVRTGDERLRLEGAFAVAGESRLDEAAVSLRFGLERWVDRGTGELQEKVVATCTFFVPEDEGCPPPHGSISLDYTDPYDVNVVGALVGGGRDCPTPFTFSAGEQVWLEADGERLALAKQVDAATGMISYVGEELDIAAFRVGAVYDLRLEGDAEGLGAELIEGVLPTVPCDWDMVSPAFWEGYRQDRSRAFSYAWTPACTYPEGMFVSSISGTNYVDSPYPGMATSYPWDDGEHSYSAADLVHLESGMSTFEAYSYVQGPAFGLSGSREQANYALSYVDFRANFLLE